MASASAGGSLHVWRVDYTCKAGGGAPDKFTGITLRRQLGPGEGRVVDVQQWGSSHAFMTYATQRGGVHGRDLRMQRDAWVVPSPPSLGVLQQVRARHVCRSLRLRIHGLTSVCHMDNVECTTHAYTTRLSPTR